MKKINIVKTKLDRVIQSLELRRRHDSNERITLRKKLGNVLEITQKLLTDLQQLITDESPSLQRGSPSMSSHGERHGHWSRQTRDFHLRWLRSFPPH